MKAEGATWAAHNGDFKDESDEESVKSNQELSHAAALGYAMDLEATMQATFPNKVVHVVGNHDMDRLTKGDFLGAINEGSAHYVRNLGPGVSAVVIDATYDAQGRNFSLMTCQEPGMGCDGQGYGSWDGAHMPSWQLEWLRETLAAEKAKSNRVLLFSHFRLDGDRDLEVEWISPRIVHNSAEVRTIIEEFKSTVLVVFHGHDHRAQDSPRIVNGIGYYTMVAIVEALEVEKAPWATIKVWPEACRVQIMGHGETPVSSCKGEAWCVNRTLFPSSVDWKDGVLGDAACEGLATKTVLL